MKWDFTPYDLESWNKAKERILFVAAEPNGNNPNSGTPDMGEWFKTATPLNKYHSNKLFYNRCEIILEGALAGKHPGNHFKNFRFMDLKATQGGAASSVHEVSEYVRSNILEVMKYFTSKDERFGIAPTVLIILGNNAQQVFSDTVRPVLLKNNVAHLQYIFMPHPSAQTIANDLLEKASHEISTKLSPLAAQPYKWFCNGRNKYGWLKIEEHKCQRYQPSTP